MNTTRTLTASAVAQMQADALETRRAELRKAAQVRFNAIGLPRYLYSTVEVAR